MNINILTDNYDVKYMDVKSNFQEIEFFKINIRISSVISFEICLLCQKCNCPLNKPYAIDIVSF